MTLYFSTNNDINFLKTLFKTLNANELTYLQMAQQMWGTNVAEKI